MGKYAEVSVPLRVGDILLYRVPPSIESLVKPGVLVEVPLRGLTTRGVVLGFRDTPPPDIELKEIISVPDPDLSIPQSLLSLALWMRDYYLTPIDSILKIFFPPGVLIRERKEVKLAGEPPPDIGDEKTKEILKFLKERKGRWVTMKYIERSLGFDIRSRLSRLEREGIVKIRDTIPKGGIRAIGSFVDPSIEIEVPRTPNKNQKVILDEIIPFIGKKIFKPFLLHGVTGSGKTAIYVWLIERVLNIGKSALILVPEIGLTPQIARVFIKKFGDEVVLYHSSFSDSERNWVWRRVKRGEKRIVIGPRSSLFLPIKDLGLIVVDEEHEPAYKQEENPPYYNARDVAVMRAKEEKIPLLLASATPSMESYFNAMKNKYRLLKLKERVRGYRSPRIELVDMREEYTTGLLSIKLLERIKYTLSKGKQVILFLNRRGFAPYLQCLDCGYVEKCSRCSVSLVYHKRGRKLKCHLCDFEKPAPSLCPKCSSIRLTPMGFGTERIEEELKSFFPDIKVLRMDLDTTRRRGAHERIYSTFKRGEARVLIGTQMVTKGFDFPEVDLVGVLLADISLNLPDFRAEERTFQILSQVTGRVRRGGDVIIQTYSPDAPALRYALRQDYEGFYREEIKLRKEYEYPPFTRIALLEIRGRERETVIEVSKGVANTLPKEGVEIQGPSPAPVERVRGFYRWRILLKGKPLSIQRIFPLDFKTPKGITIKLDIDPIDLI
jgi:primosomal protein N' (replication factor Y)